MFPETFESSAFSFNQKRCLYRDSHVQNNQNLPLNACRGPGGDGADLGNHI